MGAEFRMGKKDIVDSLGRGFGRVGQCAEARGTNK